MTSVLHHKLATINNRLMLSLCVALTLAILAVLLLVAGYLVVAGVGQLTPTLFTHLPGDTPPGMKNSIVGTIVLIGLASVVGIPLGLLSGIYLAEYDRGSRLVGPLRFICDVLAGVPSVVVGVLGYVLLVRPIGHNNGWAGALALAFIMIPIVARTTEEMLRLVPYSYREASIALGATKAVTILGVVLPGATGSIATGIMLAVARVAGETAPLIFTAGLSSYMTLDPSRPFPTMTAQIYAFRTDPDPHIRGLAFAGMLLLVVMIFALNLAIRFFTRERRAGG